MYTQNEVNMLYLGNNTEKLEMLDDVFLVYEGFFDDVFDDNMGDIGIWGEGDDVTI